MLEAPLRVFISYARTYSTPFVDRLEQSLRTHQFQPWIDRHGLEGGDQWMEIIRQPIDDCPALVVFVPEVAKITSAGR